MWFALNALHFIVNNNYMKVIKFSTNNVREKNIYEKQDNTCVNSQSIVINFAKYFYTILDEIVNNTVMTVFYVKIL